MFFHFSSYVRVFTGNKAHDMLRNSDIYAVPQSQIQLAYAVMEGEWLVVLLVVAGSTTAW
jgi:hypothetical protein